MSNILPLVEKYRPKKMDEIIGNKNEIFFLKKYIENKHIPNIILTGNPGTGKTSCALAFIKKYLEDEPDNFLELNASDDRGIEVVRSKIKIFAKQKNIKKNSDKYKIVMLDEADNMTQSAQFALRRTIEKYNYKTKFLLTCNNIENIIDSIQSLCTIMRFGDISIEEIKDRLEHICKEEKININEGGIMSIIELHENRTDIRGMINMIEIIKGNFYKKNGFIKKNDIYSICDKPSPEYVNNIISKLKENKIIEAIKISKKLKSIGFTNLDICSTFYLEIIKLNSDTNNNDIKKLDCYDCIGEYNIIFLNGNNTHIQLSNMLIKLSKILNK